MRAFHGDPGNPNMDPPPGSHPQPGLSPHPGLPPQPGFPVPPARSAGHRELWAGFLRGWVYPLALAAGISFPLRSALADWYQVPSGSMRPTILEGDRILVSNLAFGLRIPFTNTWIARWGEPKRGEIVTLASPVDGTRLVKRVIAVPGDRISMIDEQLWINGSPVTYRTEAQGGTLKTPDGVTVPSSYVLEQLPGRAHVVAFTSALPARRSFPEIEIPAGSYFVMGDNRDDSYDSRYFGLVRGDKIVGHASRIAASFDPDHYYLPRFTRWMKPLI